MSGRRIVFDTSVLLSYLCHPDKPYAVREAVRERILTAVICASAIAELADVGLRHADGPVVDAFVRSYRRLARVVGEPPARFAHVDDPKDSVFFNLAIDAEAFAIVSFD